MDEIDEMDEMEEIVEIQEIELCRICLAYGEETKMYPIEDTPYQEIFELYGQKKMTTDDELPESVCYLCNAVLKRVSAFLKLMNKTDVYLNEKIGNMTLTYKSIEKFKREMIPELHNLSYNEIKEAETEEIKEAETEEKSEVETKQNNEAENEEIKDSESPQQKSKTSDKIPNSPHPVCEESSEHSQENTLENEEQQKHHKEILKTTENNFIFPEDSSDQYMVLRYSPDSEIESRDSMDMEISVEPFTINMNISEQSNHSSNSCSYNHRTVTPDPIDFDVNIMEDKTDPEENDSNYLNRSLVEKKSQEKKGKTPEPVELRHSYFRKIEEHKATEENLQEKRVNTTEPVKYRDPCHFREQIIHTEENTPNNSLTTSDKTVKTPDPAIYHSQNLQFMEHIPVKEQTPKLLEIEFLDDVSNDDVLVKMESAYEKFLGLTQEHDEKENEETDDDEPYERYSQRLKFETDDTLEEYKIDTDDDDDDDMQLDLTESNDDDNEGANEDDNDNEDDNEDDNKDDNEDDDNE